MGVERRASKLRYLIQIFMAFVSSGSVITISIFVIGIIFGGAVVAAIEAKEMSHQNSEAQSK